MTILDASHQFIFTLDDVDISDYVVRNSLRHVDAEGGEIDTLNFELEDWTDTLTVTAWQEVKVYTANDVEWSAYNEGAYDTGNYGGFAFGGYVVRARPLIAESSTWRRWEVLAESWVTRIPRTPKVRKTYANSSAGAIVADLFTEAGLTEFGTDTHVATGPTLTLFATDGEDLNAVLDRLVQIVSDLAGAVWAWRIEADKNVWFGPIASDPAPYSIATLDAADWVTSFPPLKTPEKDIDARDIRNRITVRGGTRASDDTAETFTGDGVTDTFTVANKPIRAIVSITAGGVTQNYGVDWYDTFAGGYNCLINYSAGTVRFATAPAYGVSVVITYNYDLAVTKVIQDNASYAQYGIWFDYEINDPTIDSEQAATDAANMMLDQYAFGIVGGKVRVARLGIRAGQALTVELPLLGFTGAYIVRSVTSEFDPGNDGMLSDITFGGRYDKLSGSISEGSTGGGSIGGGSLGRGSAYAQPVTPAQQGEIGLLRIMSLTNGEEVGRLGDLSDISGCSGNGIWTTNGYFTGKVTATSGAIGGWTIGTYTLKDTAGLVGLNSEVTANNDIRFWAGHATPGSAAFRVYENGALVATSATITGEITATSGAIGGWTITTARLAGGDAVDGYTGMQSGTVNTFFAGATTVAGANAKFYVHATGALYASSATITGAITANTGYIGGTSGWVIAAGKMTSTGIGIATAAGDATYAFWAGHDTPASAEFSVTHAGAVTATAITITGGAVAGFTTSADSLTVASGGNTTTISSGATAFLAGPTGSPTVTITRAGVINATGATITGTINATAGYFGDGATRVAIEAAGINVGNTGSIRGGQTAYNTGTGWWLGYSSGYKFSLGDGSTNYFTWDGSKVRIACTTGTFAEPAIYAEATVSHASAWAIKGVATGASGVAVYGYAQSTGAGVYGESNGGYGVQGASGSSIGVYGGSAEAAGVWGYGAPGVLAQPISAANRGLIIKGYSAQSADLVQWQDSSGHVLGLIDANGGLVVNEYSLDVDSRFEGNGDANLLYIDAGADKVGIGDAAPGEKLDVAGNVNVTGLYKVDDVQVMSNRVVDARIDDAINDSTWDATTAGVLDALRDAAIAHGWIAAA